MKPVSASMQHTKPMLHFTRCTEDTWSISVLVVSAWEIRKCPRFVVNAPNTPSGEEQKAARVDVKIDTPDASLASVNVTDIKFRVWRLILVTV